MDRHNLFVTGKRLNRDKGVWQYYVKSRRAEDYKRMLLDSLYHPPVVEVDESQRQSNYLVLTHRFEGKPLVREFINNTMLGISYLWGGPVQLETTELVPANGGTSANSRGAAGGGSEQPPVERRVRYLMQGRKLSKVIL